MRDIAIGDEVYSSKHQLFARVEEVFPAAVCVKVGVLSLNRYLELYAEALGDHPHDGRPQRVGQGERQSLPHPRSPGKRALAR